MTERNEKPKNWDALELVDTLKGETTTVEDLIKNGVPEEEVRKMFMDDDI